MSKDRPWTTRTTHRLGTSICAVTALLLCLSLSGRAGGYTPPFASWPSGEFSFRVNTATFGTNLGDLSLSPDRARWWVAFALSQWRERTGASLAFTYEGDTTALCTLSDNINVVIAENNCGDPNCQRLATTNWSESGGTLQKADLCIHGPAASWALVLPITTRFDVMGVMVHEFGHALGLSHTTHTVMNDQIGASSWFRYPYGDDIDAIQSNYGTRQEGISWKARYAGGWEATPHAVGSNAWTQHPPSAARGGYGQPQNKVVVAHLGTDRKIYWRRADDPLSSGSTWESWTMGSQYTSNRSPAVAAKEYDYSQPRWVLAWANKTSLSTECSGVRVYSSSNALASGTIINLPNDCTMHAPAVAYDPHSERFVLFIVGHDTGHDRILARTSVDGVSWTSSQDLGLYTIDGVSAACPDTESCLMSYARATSLDANVVIRTFSINSTTGVVSTGGYRELGYRQQRTPPIAVQWASGDMNRWGLQWSTSVTDWANGHGSLWTSGDTQFPPDSVTWESLGGSVVSDHQFSLTSSHIGATLYAFWATP